MHSNADRSNIAKHTTSNLEDKMIKLVMKYYFITTYEVA